MTLRVVGQAFSLATKCTTQWSVCASKWRHASCVERHIFNFKSVSPLYPFSPGRRSYSSEGPSTDHRPSDFDKRILVWSKSYPALSDVPDSVPYSKMKKAKDIFRIRVNIWMGVLTLIGCAIMIYMGRKSAKEGKSIHKENIQWHEEMKKKG